MIRSCLHFAVLIAAIVLLSAGRAVPADSGLDQKVQKFLIENRSNWSDWNVPYQDGKVLYVQSLPNYRTTIDRSSSSGISISCKR